jgi:hypothetical protein
MIEARMADGTVLRFPAGTPDDVVDRAAAEYMQSAKPPAPEQSGPSTGQSFMRGLGLGARNVMEGAANSLPGMAYDAMAAIMPNIPGTMRAEGGSTAPPMRAADLARTGADALALPTAETQTERRNAAIIEPVTGALASMGGGAALSSAAQQAGAPLAQNVGRMLSTQPLTQAASAGVGGYVADATDSPVAGMAASLATPLAIAGVRRAITPVPNVNSPGRQALVQGAEREGIPLTAGQATGSPFLQNVESQFEQLPFTSGPQRAIREDQQRAFIQAAMRRAGEAADDTSPATINAARDRIGRTIGTIANRNTLRFTPQLDSELAQIEDSLRFIPAEAAGPVRARIEQLRGMASPSAAPGVPPTVPGASYRMLDSALGRSIRSTNNGDLRAALGDLRERLRAAMDASISPADASDWQQARRQYANLMVIANAAGRAGGGAAEGLMSPVALRQALDTSTGGGYVYGRGDLNELARMGQALLRPPPDSGTAGRTFANNLLTGSLVGGGAGSGAMVGGPMGAAVGAAGSLALPRVAQMLMNSPAGQAYLRNQVAANPTITSDLARALLIHQASSALPNMGAQ